jgi:hypothetical protein
MKFPSLQLFSLLFTMIHVNCFHVGSKRIFTLFMDYVSALSLNPNEEERLVMDCLNPTYAYLDIAFRSRSYKTFVCPCNPESLSCY